MASRTTYFYQRARFYLVYRLFDFCPIDQCLAIKMFGQCLAFLRILCGYLIEVRAYSKRIVVIVL